MKSIVLLVFLMLSFVAEAKNCAVYLAQNDIMASEDPTEKLIAFLNMLYEKHTLDQQQILRIANGDFQNPLQNKVNFDSDHQIFFEVYEDLFSQAIDSNKLQKWATDFTKTAEQVQKEKKKVSKTTQEAFYKMRFNRIEAGSFEFNQNKVVGLRQTKVPIKVELTNPFEMMTTVVTQKMWRNAVRSMPNQDEIGDDMPIGNITWWSAISYANRLSRKKGLPEVYDLSAIKKWEGDLESGTLEPEDTSTNIKIVKINAPDGDIYKAKGYRLPTIYEYLFVITDRGRSETNYFSKMDEDNFKTYAWEDSSGKIRRAVALLEPNRIDGQAFYDLYGNGKIWLHDPAVSGEDLKAGVDPVGTLSAVEREHVRRLQYGRDIGEMAHNMGTNSWNLFTEAKMYQRAQHIGLRLVRSLEK